MQMYVIRTGLSVRCQFFCIVHGVCIDDADPSAGAPPRNCPFVAPGKLLLLERSDDVMDDAIVPNVDVGGRRKDPMGKSCRRRCLLYRSYDSWN
jgi:hypothetical protein